MDLLNLLEQLTAASGVSGSENSIAAVAQELLTPYCDTVEQRQGNVIGILGERQSGKPHVLLDAHMDQVGFLVTAITEDGFVRVGNAGGLDCRFMPAQRVVIHGKQDIAGVICCMPPHLQNGEEHVLSVTELAIDTGYTKEDLDIWSECIARGLGMVGVEKEYILQNAFGYGLFTGGFGIHHGAQKFGAITVPISAGNTKRQLETMKDFQSDVITCTPSYAMYLGESLENSDINLEDINLKIGIHGAEMWTEEMRHKIEDTLNIKAYNIYGLTEIMGPGVAQECVEQNGMHIQDDHFYPEIINPKTGETLPAGQKGELVLTTLTKTGIPILRFRTKDLTSLIIEQCACGRTSVKMSRITGRSDDMLKIRGVMVFPSQIEKALLKIKGASPNYLIKVTRPDTLDEVEVKVEATKELFSDEMKEMEKTEAMIVKSIKSETGLRVNVTLCEPESLPRSEGKSVRVIDERNFE